MMTVAIDKRQLAELQSSIQGTGRKLNRELKIAVRQAANDTRKIMAKKVTRELNVTARAVKAFIPIPIVKGDVSPSARVRLKHSSRAPLRDFKARQTRAGVSYRIDKRKGGSKVAGAFMGPRPGSPPFANMGGHVFKRMGPSRFPIAKLYGASPWGAFKKRHLKPPTKIEARAALRKRVDRRIRDAIRKQQGKF